MMYYKTPGEIELIRTNCLLVSDVLALVAEMLKPGVTAKQIDRKAEEYIRDKGAKPAFKGYNGFPASLCVSVNEAVVHGIPSDKEFREGDVVSVDCGVFMNDYYGDAAYTFAIGDVEDKVMRLLRITRDSLYAGISQAVAGKRLGDIGYAVQELTERTNGYGVVRELVGHGIGKSLHEPPEVPNFGRRGSGPKLKEGLVIAIEPMINLGKRNVKQLRDGWTIVTRDGMPSAHFEHTVAVGKESADVLSDHERVEQRVKNNPYLKDLS